MYTSEDLSRARQAAKRTGALSCALLALGLGLLVAGLVARVRMLAYAGLILPAMAAYFVFDVWCSPRFKYVRFLRDMASGRSHEATGRILSVSQAPRASEEGVMVYDLMVKEADAAAELPPTLFHWDAQKPLPQADPGRAVRLCAYGRYVTDIAPV